MVTKNKDLFYYLNLPWTYTVETDRDEHNKVIYIISVNELPGVITDAHTLEEGINLIKEAMLGTFKLYIKHGEEIPEPLKQDDYKGNIAYRTSSKRHHLIAKQAQKQNQSLSKIIDECIDKSLLKQDKNAH